jgi:biofilm PGA synthesis lipoprotein PgaB
MRRCAALLLLFLCALLAPMHSVQAQARAEPGLVVLGYGDIVDAGDPSRPNAVTVTALTEQLAWMREQGYSFVRLQDVFAAREGRRALPPRAVLLTFEGGWRSFHTRALPLLRAFRTPAVLAIPTGRIDAPASVPIETEEGTRPRSEFLDWREIGAAAGSGLVEIASAGDRIDLLLPAAPGGVSLPAATTRIFDVSTRTYESDEAYAARLRDDLTRSRDRIRAMTGGAPRAIVWPRGAANGIGRDIAGSLGMGFSFDRRAQACEPRDAACGRLIITRDTFLGTLVERLREPSPPQPVRVVQVSIDFLADPDPVQFARNLAALVARVKRLGVNTIYLQAFVDTDAKGVAAELYFKARHMQTKVDVFGLVAATLKRETGVAVYAWLPVLAFAAKDPALKVQSLNPGMEAPAPNPGYLERLSPFVPQSRQMILDIYEDMAKYAAFDGIMFNDDAKLSDFEDANPTALAFKQTLGLPGDVNALRADPAVTDRWTIAKTEALIALTKDIEAIVEKHRGPVRTARNIFPLPITEPYSQRWYAQEYGRFLESYDETVVLAMPHLSEAKNPKKWMRELVAKVKATPGAVPKTVFMLQSVDWTPTTVPLPAKELRDQMRFLLENGILNFGYCPENFILGLPDAEMVAGPLSLNTFPLSLRGEP